MKPQCGTCNNFKLHVVGNSYKVLRKDGICLLLKICGFFREVNMDEGCFSHEVKQ